MSNKDHGRDMFVFQHVGLVDADLLDQARHRRVVLDQELKDHALSYVRAVYDQAAARLAYNRKVAESKIQEQNQTLDIAELREILFNIESDIVSTCETPLKNIVLFTNQIIDVAKSSQPLEEARDRFESKLESLLQEIETASTVKKKKGGKNKRRLRQIEYPEEEEEEEEQKNEDELEEGEIVFDTTPYQIESPTQKHHHKMKNH